jgi:hypothetical protein
VVLGAATTLPTKEKEFLQSLDQLMEKYLLSKIKLHISFFTFKRIYTPEEAMIFPNPITDKATFSFGADLDNAQLHIYNLTGQRVRSVSNISGDHMIIYKGDLKPGIYLLQLLENNQKILIQKMQILD